MISISKLYCGELTPGDRIRYGKKGSGTLEADIAPTDAASRRPVVVWNITRACNLKCVHCYSDSGSCKADDELSTQEAKQVLEDLSRFGVPRVLFSGGEPLMREDLFELLGYAGGLELQTVISTNGTLINADIAKCLKKHCVSYVGISLDGIGEVNDKFRGVAGAFDKAIEGIKNCRDAGLRTGVRLTLTRGNFQELNALFDFLEAEGIERACFYHLVPSGRGVGPATERLTHAQSRQAIETILLRTRRMVDSGRKTDILTVDNHADGVYLYLKLAKENPEKAENLWELLRWNGGGMYSSGVGIGCVDFHGKVRADQFWRHYELGDVRKKPFSDIWTDGNEPLLRGLRNRRKYIKGRCRVCKFLEGCGGSLRVRAELEFGDLWAPDPACYLTDEEIGVDEAKRAELTRRGEIFSLPSAG